MAFDKTGTLTEGCFEVTDVIPLNGTGPDKLLRIAGTVEQQSNHPLALAVVQAAQEKGLDLLEATGLENMAGRVPFAVGLSRASRRIILQNLVISMGVIGLLIVTSVLGLVQLSGAVILHEGSTILVVLNALRLLNYNGKRKPFNLIRTFILWHDSLQ